MITVFGEGRGFRVVWLLEEMGLEYRLRPVDLLAGVEKDAEFLAVNPAGLIPAIQDGGGALGEAERAYMARTSGREAYERAMETCEARRAWFAQAPSQLTALGAQGE